MVERWGKSFCGKDPLHHQQRTDNDRGNHAGSRVDRRFLIHALHLSKAFSWISFDNGRFLA
jgi:hypothetical protein